MTNRWIWCLPITLLGACAAGGAGGAGSAGQLVTLQTAASDPQGLMEVDNGAFFDWVASRPGSWVRTKQVQEQAGSRTETTGVTRLLERTASRVVVQIGDSPGSTAAYPRTTWVPAKGRGPEPSSDVQEGDESLEVGGKTLPCHRMEYRFGYNGSTCTMKSWRSREVPGAVVKNEQVWTKNGVLERTMTTVVVEWHVEE